jgi:hypothetical protein
MSHRAPQSTAQTVTLGVFRCRAKIFLGKPNPGLGRLCRHPTSLKQVEYQRIKLCLRSVRAPGFAMQQLMLECTSAVVTAVLLPVPCVLRCTSLTLSHDYTVSTLVL